ncbi:hypothetical protein PbJCM13498_17470 [Prolixibacter bellariivorans]|uniref:Uncharacterized protein n=1 Tax=Prolixibacter bellariivorans TaxID=314319 RepID=A0A5M4AYP4_9BACT|nr:hypothetical protein PbJCM13498_17470 [Prolixibacter bellariivorans]
MLARRTFEVEIQSKTIGHESNNKYKIGKSGKQNINRRKTMGNESPGIYIAGSHVNHSGCRTSAKTIARGTTSFFTTDGFHPGRKMHIKVTKTAKHYFGS